MTGKKTERDGIHLGKREDLMKKGKVAKPQSSRNQALPPLNLTVGRKRNETGRQ